MMPPSPCSSMLKNGKMDVFDHLPPMGKNSNLLPSSIKSATGMKSFRCALLPSARCKMQASLGFSIMVASMLRMFVMAGVSPSPSFLNRKTHSTASSPLKSVHSQDKCNNDSGSTKSTVLTWRSSSSLSSIEHCHVAMNSSECLPQKVKENGMFSRMSKKASIHEASVVIIMSVHDLQGPHHFIRILCLRALENKMPAIILLLANPGRYITPFHH